MKLYYAPGACSMADHIALNEAGIEFESEQVDLKSKRTESGADFTKINPKGYVPALDTGNGVLTENIAILIWIADRAPDLMPTGDMARYRLIEALAFISTELHKAFKPFFAGGGDADKRQAAKMLDKRLGQIATTMRGDYLFGDRVSVADAYLFVMLTWMAEFGLTVPSSLTGFVDRMKARDAVVKTMREEGVD